MRHVSCVCKSCRTCPSLTSQNVAISTKQLSISKAARVEALGNIRHPSRKDLEFVGKGHFFATPANDGTQRLPFEPLSRATYQLLWRMVRS
jgi:hypothetical protein